MRIHRPRKPRELLKLDFIISVDRSLMSNHHNHEFLGFMTTGPAIGIPERLWLYIACPRIPVDKYGRPWQAPYGLRKIEAKLLEEGFRAAVIDPDYVPYYVSRTGKALLIGHHDYFAMGPPSNEWWMITGKTPVNALSFQEFISFPEIWEARKNRGLKIIVGGPAAWQWLVNKEALKKWPVDTIVEGEGERVIIELAEKIMNDEELPKHIVVKPGESPRIDEIPLIKYPSVNGLIEIMRGCPRGCKFCSVTARPLRYIPLDMIEKEIRVNIKAGVKHVLFYSEDVLLYGADIVRPRPEPLLRLHELVLKYDTTFAWSHASLAAVKYAEDNHKLITKLTDMLIDYDKRRFIGVEVGIETGSPRLAKIIMPGKSAPYPPEKWPDIVEDAFMIMHDNNIIPAATFILGLPDEKPEDVIATIELLERLKHYRSLIVPMFFVPMGRLRDREWFRREMLTPEHIEALRAALHHSLRWGRDLVSRYLRGNQYLIARSILNIFLKYVEYKSKKIEKQLPRILSSMAR